MNYWHGCHLFRVFGGPITITRLPNRQARWLAFHSGEAAIDDERVNGIAPEKLAELVLDAGLMTWLIRKVS